MASGKKGKKQKGKTIGWNEFMQEAGNSAPSGARTVVSNWADEVEDGYNETYESSSSRPKAAFVLPTAPKAARGLEDYSDKVPHHPPFSAYLSNIPYDVDEDEIGSLFGNLKIQSMNIPKEDRPGEMPKLKGYGYVNFEDRDSLLGALAIPDCTLKGRRIRIEVATVSENERKRGGRMDMGRDRPEVSMGDWRSGNTRTDDNDRDRDRRGGFGRDRDRDRDRNGTYDRAGSGTWRDASDRPTFESRNRDRDRDRGFDRDRDDRRGFGPRSERSDTRNGGGMMRRDEMSRRDPDPESEMKARPKLNLMPRTKAPEEPVAPAEPEAEAKPAASIFGSAKPVDTSARERQIEERLAKEQSKVGEIKREGAERKRTEEEPIRRIRRDSPPRRTSPQRHSPHRSPQRDTDDKKNDRDRRGPPPRDDKPKREERRVHEREMPKQKEPEPVNLVASNKYASLEADLSD